MNIDSKPSIGILGGDKRLVYTGKYLEKEGYKVLASGFEKYPEQLSFFLSDFQKNIEESEIVLLPVPPIKEGNLNCVYSEKTVDFGKDILPFLKGKKVFTPMKEKLLALYPNLSECSLFDYGEREDFAVRNAMPTAEGALYVAMGNTEKTICSSRCLVCGCGRIGKVLAPMLKRLWASVWVSARKPEDIGWIEANGMNSLRTDGLEICQLDFDIIFNTVPHMVFDRKLLSRLNKETLIIDLASVPGGVDFQAAEELGIKTIHALSLPGKISPDTAGKIIKDTVVNMLREAEM